MKVNVNFEFTEANEGKALFEALSAVFNDGEVRVVTVAEPEVAEVPVSAKTDEPEVAEVPVSAKTAEPVEADTAEAADDFAEAEVEMSYEELVSAVTSTLRNMAKGGNRTRAKELLNKYHVPALSKITEIPQEQLVALYNEAIENA